MLGLGYFFPSYFLYSFFFFIFFKQPFRLHASISVIDVKDFKVWFCSWKSFLTFAGWNAVLFLMLSMFWKAITGKVFAKWHVGTTNLKAPCARENLPKPFWLICWSILFLLSQQIFTLQESLVSWHGWWGSLWSLNVFPLLLLQMLQSKQALRYCKMMYFSKFFSVFSKCYEACCLGLV